MKVFALYDKNDKFIIAFPTRKEAEKYGKEVLGVENGCEDPYVEPRDFEDT